MCDSDTIRAGSAYIPLCSKLGTLSRPNSHFTVIRVRLTTVYALLLLLICFVVVIFVIVIVLPLLLLVLLLLHREVVAVRGQRHRR
jgi:hypothetical protein